jgi:Acyl-CoA dehydrogenases
LIPLLEGKTRVAFAVTEPNTGLDTTRLKTRAIRQGDHYIANGQKIWITGATLANKILLIARTTPIEETAGKPAKGLSLFFTDFDRNAIEVRPIPKMGTGMLHSCELFIENLKIPKEDLIGEEGKGFYYLLDSLNPERVIIGAEAISLGKLALSRAVQYAKERTVFDRPIGQNQGIQHPLAANWAELEAAQAILMRAARMYDNGEDAGAYANAAKYLGAEAGFKACTQAVMTHGGMGYAKEFDVERYLREVMLPRLAPVSQQLILCYLAEKVLGLPKSY